MGDVKYKWMIVSVFYRKQNWHKLLFYFSKYKIRLELSLDCFYIFLSEDRGEHVTFCLKFHHYEQKIEEVFFNDLQRFLTAEKSSDLLYSYPLNDIFENYPNNSYLIHHGYFSSINSFSEKQTSKIRSFISEIISTVFVNEKIEVESIYTFLIYLQFSALKSVFSDIDRALNTLKKILKQLLKTEVDVDKTENGSSYKDEMESIINMFINNQDILIEIFEEIWLVRKGNSNLKWIKKWELLCVDFVRFKQFKTGFIQLNGLVFEHLGLSKEKNLHSSLQLITKTLEHNFSN